MKLVFRAWPNCYEELIRYYPRFYRDVREMRAILHAQGRMADAFYDAADRVYNNNFIDYMDEEMIAALEKFLGLSAGSRTLEERRGIVKAYFIGFGKISATAIRRIIAAYADVDSDIVFEPIDDSEYPDHALYITIYQDEDQSIDTRTIFDIIKMRLPAHIWYYFFLIVQVLIDSMVERAYLTSTVLTFRDFYDFRLNGQRLLDGTWHLGVHMVPLHTWLVNSFPGARITETVEAKIKSGATIAVDSMTERAYLTSMVLTFVDIYGRYLDGMWLLDGTWLLGAVQPAPRVGIVCGCPGAAVSESIEAAVFMSRDLWYLDGAYMLDGARILDAEIITEMEVI